MLKKAIVTLGTTTITSILTMAVLLGALESEVNQRRMLVIAGITGIGSGLGAIVAAAVLGNSRRKELNGEQVLLEKLQDRDLPPEAAHQLLLTLSQLYEFRSQPASVITTPVMATTDQKTRLEP